MSEIAESTAAPAPLTADEFDQFMAADETILELSLNDFIPTLYNYKQAKQLLQHFNLTSARQLDWHRRSIQHLQRLQRVRTIRVQMKLTRRLSSCSLKINTHFSFYLCFRSTMIGGDQDYQFL
jgi:hypothetical protein